MRFNPEKINSYLVNHNEKLKAKQQVKLFMKIIFQYGIV